MAELGIDLGTAYTTVCETPTSVIREPSAVAFNSLGQIVSVGTAAAEMEGRVAPERLLLAYPISSGTIGDFDGARALVVYMLERAAGTRRLLGRFVATLPACATDIERKAVEEVLRGLGARHVRVVPKGLAIARGAGIARDEKHARMVVDIGAGTTEIAVLSFGDIVAVESLKIGGNAMDTAIIQSVRLEHRLAIGRPSAERLKIALGYVGEPLGRPMVAVSGQDLTTARPMRIMIEEQLIATALRETVDAILNGIDDLVAHLAPDVAIDVAEHGMLLCGGAAQLLGLAGCNERTHEDALRASSMIRLHARRAGRGCLPIKSCLSN